MANWKQSLKRIAQVLGKVPILLVIVIVFVIGYRFSTAVHSFDAPLPTKPEQAAAGANEVWTCSMHAQIRLPEPGQCPICGMDLVLAEGSPAPGGKPSKEKQPLYACSMFCLPPQPNPGKCQICGMDMVEVDVDEGTDDGSSSARTLTLSSTAQKLAEIQVEPVSRKFVSAEIRMVGKVDYDETRLKYITAWVPGRLERLYVDYTGIPVNEGDHMVYLYSPELATAQTELLQALERTQDSSREGSLVNQRAQDWLEDIRDKFRLWGLTDEQIQQIEERGTSSDYMNINAPMGGIVIHKNAVEGMYVNTGTRIYTIADLSRVWVRLDAYESDIKWLRYGQEVEFETEAYSGETFKGRIAFIDPVLDARTRTVDIRVNVDNPDGRLKPEMFVRAIVHSKVAEGGRVIDAELAGKWISPMHPEIVKDEPGTCDVCGMPLVRAETFGFVSVETGDAIPPIVIPASAALKTGKRAVVYLTIPNSPGKYEGREVVLGPRAGDHYIVLENLNEGEQVVVNGNFKIDSAMQIVAKPSMMNPTGGGRPPAHDHGEHGAQSEEQSANILPQPRAEVAQTIQPIEVPPQFSAQLAGTYDAYLDVQAALSRDDASKAREATATLVTRLVEVDMALLTGKSHDAWMKEQASLKSIAEKLSKTTSIEDARLQFALLSESMIATAKRFGTGGKSELHRFHCPMAFDGRGADWLQLKKRTANPFFGSAMFRCGNLEETIESNSPKTEEDADGRP